MSGKQRTTADQKANPNFTIIGSSTPMAMGLLPARIPTTGATRKA
jgi:hypothetical protein